MSERERIGVDPATDRELSLLRVSSPQELRAEALPPRPFLCLLAWNVEGVAAAELGHVASMLVDAGCGYVCAFGRGTTTVDDAVDWECIERKLEGKPVSFVMTTWHDDPDPTEALWFFLENTRLAEDIDDPDYEPWNAPCRHAVVIDIGGTIADVDWLRAALAAPRRFVEENPPQ